MKPMKSVLNAAILVLLMAPAVLWAAKPTPDQCPCWYYGANNGIWGAIQDVDFDVTILRYWEHDLKPDDIHVQLEVAEGIYPYSDPPDTEICEHMWVEVKWQPTYDTYSCEVNVYDWGYESRGTVEEELASDLELKSCLSAVRLLRATAMEY